MKINLEQLLVLQNEVLKPFSPTQEFALLNLVVDHVDQKELEVFGQNIVHAFPHVQRLYNGFVSATRSVDNVVPFAVPINDGDNALRDVLDGSEGSLYLGSELHEILVRAQSRVPVIEPHVDELNFPVDHSEPVTVDQITSCVMAGLRSGYGPIVVRATKHQLASRSGWAINCRKLFERKFVEDTAPRKNSVASIVSSIVPAGRASAKHTLQ